MPINPHDAFAHPLTAMTDPEAFLPRFLGVVLREGFDPTAAALLAQAPAALTQVLGVDADDARGWLDDAQDATREEYADQGAPADWDADAVTWGCLLLSLAEEHDRDTAMAVASRAAGLAADHHPASRTDKH